MAICWIGAGATMDGLRGAVRQHIFKSLPADSAPVGFEAATGHRMHALVLCGRIGVRRQQKMRYKRVKIRRDSRLHRLWPRRTFDGYGSRKSSLLAKRCQSRVRTDGRPRSPARGGALGSGYVGAPSCIVTLLANERMSA
jgi:hypothetical protein